MPRSARFAASALRIARFCNDHRLTTAEGLELMREEEEDRHAAMRCNRREWLNTVGRVAASAAAASVAAPVDRLLARVPAPPALDVGIVGAGLAGLACADALAGRGLRAAVYDASARTGGRCWSLRGLFPGQVAERGGEFIDNLHKTMLQYANRFGLSVEDVTKQPGEVFYFLGGRPVPESAVVEEFRDFVGVMRLDLVQLSQEVTAFSHTDTDVALDRTSLLAYLEDHNRAGIDLVGYGTNAKMMVGFTSRPWAGHGSNGSSYSDLANHQTTWETNPARATPSRAVLTDYSGGDRGETLDPSDISARHHGS